MKSLKNKARRFTSFALAFFMIISLTPSNIGEISMVKAASTTTATYVDANGNTQTHTAIILDKDTVTGDTTLSGEWYVVQSSFSDSDNRVTLSGETNIILADGCQWKVGGIQHSSDTALNLNIYGQSRGTGTMIVEPKAGKDYAGIKITSGAAITINGGTIQATGGSKGGAGIGGSKNQVSGTITINGGTVTATGNGGGAGIGGGPGYRSLGTITINGGTVTAIGNGGAGIGGGSNASQAGAIYINGGTVTATAESTADGIGSGGNIASSGYLYTSGNAFIIAKASSSNYKNIRNLSSQKSGVIIQGTSGQVYGTTTLSTNATIPSATTLDVPTGTSLSLAAGTTLTNNGSIYVSGTGTLGTGIYGSIYYPLVLTDAWSSSISNHTYSGTTACYAKKGEQVEIVPSLKSDGSTFSSWQVTSNGNATDLSISNNQFTMPEKPLEIAATYKKTPTSSNFTFKAPSNLSYNGAKKEAAVTTTISELKDAMTVHYYDSKGKEVTDAKGHPTAPTEAGTYTVKVSVSATTNYFAANVTNNYWTFTINKVKASTPTPKAENETISKKADGKISNVTDEMEYRLADADQYTSVESGKTEVENLAAGTYYVRHKTTNNYEQSDEAQVVIESGRKLYVTLPGRGAWFGYYISADKTELDYNDTCNVTVEIEDGYEVPEELTITVTDSNENVKKYTGTKTSDTTYTFEIPNVKMNIAILSVSGVYKIYTDDLFTFTAPENLTYDGTAKAATVQAVKANKQIGDITVRYYDSKGKEVTDAKGNPTAPTDAGTYEVKINVTSTDTYSTIENLSNAGWTFTISPKAINANVTAQNKTYDGKTDATVKATATEGVVEGEALTITGLTGTFADANVGEDKEVTVDSQNVKVAAGNDKTNVNNYTISYAETVKANIVKKEITASVTAKDKVYDGTTDATVEATATEGVVEGEALTITGLTGTFEDANAGTDKKVTIDSSNAVVTAAEGNDQTDVNNYTVSYPTETTATIHKANMTSDVKVDTESLNKTYDGKAVLTPSVEMPVGASKQVKYYKVIDDKTVDELSGAPTDAGTYKVVVTVTKENYNDVVISNDFTIAKAAAAAPSTDTVKAAAETIKGKEDGKITGLDDTMEFSTDGGESYFELSEDQTEMADLAAGTYFVRYKETANYNASEAIELTVAEGRQLNIVLPADQVEYTMTAEPTSVDYDGSTTVKVTLKDGCEATEDFKLVATYKDAEEQEQKVTYKVDPDSDNPSVYTFTIENINTDLTLSIPDDGVKDGVAPTATVTVDDNAWKEFLSNVTFGKFFKESKTVTVEAADNCGAENVKVEYYLSDEALTEDDVKDDGITWTTYSEAFTLDKNSKQIVYVKVTDKAGNMTVVNSDGIVVYTDSTAEETNLEYVKDVSKDDLTATVSLNGNTIKDISVTTKDAAGEEKTTTLTEGEEYTIKTDDNNEKATITFKNDYLKTLAVGSYTFTTTYNPLGESYVEADGNEAPATTTVSLAVRKATMADLFNFTAPEDLAYNGKAKEASVIAIDEEIAKQLGDITIHYYDSEGNEVKGANGVLAAPTEVGTYTVKIDVADSDTYKGATGLTNKDWTFTIVQGENPSTPSADDVKATAETVKGKADGKITGVNDTMEYSTDGGKTYKSIDKGVTELTNLAAGTYSIRYKETTNYKASKALEVTVKEGKELTTADLFTVTLPENATYDGKAKEASVAAKDEQVAKQLGTITIHYYDSEGNEVIDKDGNVAAPTNVGTYTVKIDVAESDAYKGATGLTNKDWTFTIGQGTNPSTPSKDDVKAVAETVQGKADGKITGVNDTMEYSTDGGKTYNAIPEGTTELTNLAAGTYSIRYKETASYKASDAIEVTVEEGVPAVATKVELNTTSKTLTGIGKTKQLKATVTPSNAADKEIVWTSSNPNVATVDANGKVTAVGNGTATITATVKNGTAKATCKVKVNTSTEKTKTQLTLSKKLKALPSGNNIKASWGKVSGADGYYVYAQYCGSDFSSTPTATLKGNDSTSVTIKKINKKAIDKTKVYKFYVAAYKTVNGKNIVIGKSICAHIAGANNKKYTNPNKVTTTKSSYSLKVGKTAQIKASQTLVNAKKKALTDSHATTFRYASSDKSVATVNWTTGKITAVAKGTCKVYVYARNGYTKTISVTVK